MVEEEKRELVEWSNVEKGLCLSNNSSAEKLELAVDQVIEEYVGSFGFSQLLHVFLVSLAWIFYAHSTLATIFTDAQPDMNGDALQTHHHHLLVDSIRSSTSSRDAASVCGLKPGTWEWIGGNSSSTIAEWRLVCDRKFLAAIPTSLYFLGSLIGTAVYGRLANAFLGRKRALFISCLLTSATNFVASLSQNIWIYALFRFANDFPDQALGYAVLY